MIINKNNFVIWKGNCLKYGIHKPLQYSIFFSLDAFFKLYYKINNEK